MPLKVRLQRNQLPKAPSKTHNQSIGGGVVTGVVTEAGIGDARIGVVTGGVMIGDADPGVPTGDVPGVAHGDAEVGAAKEGSMVLIRFRR